MSDNRVLAAGKINDFEFRKVIYEAVDLLVCGDSVPSVQLLQSIKSTSAKVVKFLTEMINFCFTRDALCDENVSVIIEFIGEDVLYLEDIRPRDVVVEVIQSVLNFMWNPVSETCNAKTILVLKPLLERIALLDAQVEFFDKVVHASALPVEVVNEILVGSEWNCKLYLQWVVQLLNQLNFRSLTLDSITSWVKALFDKMQKLSLDDMNQLPDVMRDICKVSCLWKLEELLLSEVDQLMLMNEKFSSDEMGLQQALDVETKCVSKFLDVMRLNPLLGTRLAKFFSSKLPASNFIHISRFSFSLCLSCIAPGAPTGNQLRESLENVLRKQVLFLCENEQNCSTFVQYRLQLPPLKTLSGYLNQCIDLCSAGFGGDKLLEGIVGFGFLLMEHFGPHPLVGSTSPSLQGSSSLTWVPYEPLSTRQLACRLGTEILESVFIKFEICRSSILIHTLTKTYLKASSKGAIVQHYSQLFAKLIRIAPVTVFENISKLSDWFDYLPMLPFSVVVDLLYGLRPLIKLNENLRSRLLTVVKRAHRSGNDQSREVAAYACLAMLRNVKLVASPEGLNPRGTIPCSISLSQVATDLHALQGGSYNNNLCFELLACLRRCLHHSQSSKKTIYQIVAVIVQDNESLSCALIELLYQHLSSFSTEELTLSFDACFDDNGALVEPLGHLINSVSDCLHAINQRLLSRNVAALDIEDPVLTQVCRDCFKTLNEMVAHFSYCNLSDLGIQLGMELNVDGPINLERLKLVWNVYQALTHFKLRSIEANLDESPDVEELKNLLERLEQLFAIGKDSLKSPNLFSLSCLRFVSAAVLFPTISGEDEKELFNDLRDSESLKTLILRLVTSQCESCLWHNTVNTRFLYSSSNAFQWANDCFSGIAFMVFRAVVFHIEDPPVSQTSTKKAYIDHMIECLIWLIKVLSSRFMQSVEPLFKRLLSERLSNSQNSHGLPNRSIYSRIVERIQILITRAFQNPAIQRMTLQYLLRLLSVVVDIQFANCTSSGLEPAKELKDCCQWLCKSTSELTGLDTTNSKLLLNLCLSSCVKIQTCHFAARVAANVFFELSADSQPPKLCVRIVSNENAESLASELNNFLHNWLNNTQWLNLVFTKILSAASKRCGASSILNNIENVEKKLSNEFLAISHTLLRLLSCAYSGERTFFATVTNCHLYYTNMTLFLKNVVFKIQNVDRSRRPTCALLSSEVERVLHNSQAPMKDGLHNAMEHAAASLWKSVSAPPTSAAQSAKRQKTKRASREANPGLEQTAAGEVEMENETEDLGFEGNDKQKLKVNKETKNIPQLIFAMEQMEKSSFQLCKIVGLDSNKVISSVNLRDFRVREDSNNALAVNNVFNVETDDQPPSRRARTN